MPSTIPLKQYDDLGEVNRDQQVLEEAGLHPAIQRGVHDDRVASDSDIEGGGTVVLAIPEAEAHRAMEILETSWEAQVAEVEDYAD